MQDAFTACAGKPDAFLLQCQIAYTAVGAGHGADLTDIVESMGEKGAPSHETLEEIISNRNLRSLAVRSAYQ